MAGWALGLGIIGTVIGAVGAVSGFYAFILSGYRVKINLLFAIPTKDGGHIEFDPDWSGEFAEYADFILDSSFLQILVIARNSGRSKIEVRQLLIQNYRKKAKKQDEKGGHSFFLSLRPPLEAKAMPHLLDFGTSCSWLIPYEDIRILTMDTVQGEVVRNSIFAEIRLADGRSAYSKRRGLSPKQIDSFQEKWGRYRDERI